MIKNAWKLPVDGKRSTGLHLLDSLHSIFNKIAIQDNGSCGKLTWAYRESNIKFVSFICIPPS